MPDEYENEPLDQDTLDLEDDEQYDEPGEEDDEQLAAQLTQQPRQAKGREDDDQRDEDVGEPRDDL